jgi:hypothetical protein
MKNLFGSIKQWAPEFHKRVCLVAHTEMMDHFLDKFMKRLETDLNRIAMNRIADGSLTGSLTFTVVKAGPKELHIKPSDPVLFRKLEFGEFNPDGTLKTPPHSVLKDYKAIIKV